MISLGKNPSLIPRHHLQQLIMKLSKLTTPTFQLMVSTCVPPNTFNVHKAVFEAGCP
jgi:hypothetical protein